MLAAAVEQKPRSGFDDRSKPDLPEERRNPFKLPCESGGEGIEPLMVDRDSDPLVSRLGKQMNGLLRIVTHQPVGVVTEVHSMKRRKSDKGLDQVDGIWRPRK